VNKCLDCKTAINKRSKRCHSCEIICRHKSGMYNFKRKNNPAYLDGRTTTIHLCKFCSNKLSYKTWRYGKKQCTKCYIKTLKGKTHPLYGKHHSKITKQKISKALKGKQSYTKNPNWKGGLSFEPYNLKWTEYLKKKIRKQYKQTCQLCSKFGNNVHHVDYNKNNCKENNLIVLCCSCHSKTNYDRNYWYAYFTYLLEHEM